LKTIVCAALVTPAIAQSPFPVGSALEANRIFGGLCVQVGCDDLAIPTELARTGRFLIQVLDTESARVARAREQIHAQGIYGIVSADQIASPAGLPYAENLVNVLIVRTESPNAAMAAEIGRVLRPGGLALVAGGQAGEAALKEAGFQVESAEKGFIARKPWPAAMDEWTHPRHGADGNTVSGDTLVGPPRRVRWVAGPSRENARLVTAAGRNFYADVLARDGFNGLKLWEHPTKAGGPAAPVAVGNMVFAVVQKLLWPSTRRPARRFASIPRPALRAI
jgi:hypothetical protein